MVPICSADRTLIVSYRRAQALGCLICIIPCSAFSFSLNKEQYKEWDLKIQVMLSGRIMDLFCTKMPVLLVCLLQLLRCHAAVRAGKTKPQLWACPWLLSTQPRSSTACSLTRVATSIGAEQRSTHPSAALETELGDKSGPSRLPVTPPLLQSQSLRGTWGFTGKKAIKHASELGTGSAAPHICKEAWTSGSFAGRASPNAAQCLVSLRQWLINTLSKRLC